MGTPSCYLFLQAAAARGGQLLLLQRVAVVQRETQHLILQLQHLVEVGADLTLHAAVVGLQLTQALSAGLGLVQALLQLLALPQQCLLLPLFLAQLLLQTLPLLPHNFQLLVLLFHELLEFHMLLLL